MPAGELRRVTQGTGGGSVDLSPLQAQVAQQAEALATLSQSTSSALSNQLAQVQMIESAFDELQQNTVQITDDAEIYFPAGSGNTSNRVYETINNRTYEARLDESNPSANIEHLLSVVGAENHFNLRHNEYPWDAAIAHMYRQGMKVSICTDTHALVWIVKKGTTVATRRINPSAANSPAYAVVSVTELS